MTLIVLIEGFNSYDLLEEPENNSTAGSSMDVARRTADTALTKLGDSAAGMCTIIDHVRIIHLISQPAHFLHERSYKGLEPRVGQDAPSILEQGRRGIARGYDDDHRQSS